MMPRIPLLRTAIPQLNGRSVQLPPKQALPWYRRPEHVAWSKAIIARAGMQCEKCGASGVRLYADHIKELRDGGSYSLDNGQALCASCHQAKTLVERARRALHEWKGL